MLWIITAITIFVLALLLIIIVRFNARANPTPSRTTHNTLLEVMWTIVPVIILVLIAIPSFRLLFTELDVPTPDLTVKATGKQWYWSYAYPDNGNFEFDSLIVAEKDLKADQPRLLTVDNEMVVPVNKVVHVLVTGADVIHSFNVPSFGIRIDAIPGRINETWFKATIARDCSTVNAPNCAARIMRSCRSRCGSRTTRTSRPGPRRRNRNTPTGRALRRRQWRRPARRRSDNSGHD